MRILFVNQFFWPDSAPTGKLLEGVVRDLAAHGYDVTVLCSQSSYVKSEAGEAPPVAIHRLPGLPYSRYPVGRLLSWVVFLMWAILRSLLLPRFDVTVTLTTPPGLAMVGVLHKLLRGSRSWCWEMDLYPDVAVGVGTMRSGALGTRLARYFLNRQRSSADGVIALGECMKTRILSHGLDPSRVFVAENWSDSQTVSARPFPSANPLVVLYSGNLGLAHETETIAETMRRMDGGYRHRFDFVGGGARHDALRNHCQTHRIGNVRFLPYAQEDKISDNLEACHIGLVTLKPECLGAVVPSKVYMLLAAGRPFLFIGPSESTPAVLARTHGCGWQVDCGDVDGVVALLERLAENPELLRSAGASARRLFESRYDTRHGTRRVAELVAGQTIGTKGKRDEGVPERTFAATAGG